ncbi:MAG TPA: hypothetical protein GXX38_03875 [Clostridia bacterium]|nr:hypothetical protein [Clostridia bacterium]
MNILVFIWANLDKIAVKLRNLQRGEILEAEEMFLEGQTGSSVMSYEPNPIIGERIAGLARLLRSNALAVLGHVFLWHERDISYSSVERVIILLKTG